MRWLSIAFVVVCVASLFISEVCSHGHRLEKRRRYCGKVLVETLVFICNGEFYEPDKRKRGDDESRREFSAPWLLSLLEPRPRPKLDDRFLSPKSASQIFSNDRANNLRRATRAIIDECCHKSCTTNELFSYCSPPSLDTETDQRMSSGDDLLTRN